MILVTGAGRQLGRELLRMAAVRGTSALGLARAELDIADRDAVAPRARRGVRSLRTDQTPAIL